MTTIEETVARVSPYPDPAQLARCAAVFEPADPPRASTVAFWDPDGDALPRTTDDSADNGADNGADDGANGASGASDAAMLTVVVPRGDTPGGPVRRKAVPALHLPISTAVQVLARSRTHPDTHPATVAWGGAALLALQLLARGRLLPGVSDAGYDAWRVGPLGPADIEQIDQLAAALPAYARAVPRAGRKPLTLPDSHHLIRCFLDAVADALPRTPAAAAVTGSDLFAAPATAAAAPQLREWAQTAAAGIDTGVRISLRVVFPDPTASPDEAEAALRAVVSVHSLRDPTQVVDAEDLWRGRAEGFGDRARTDVLLAARRAAKTWPPLERLGLQAVPDALELTDDEVDELLGPAADQLSGAGVEVRWPKELARSLSAKAVVAKTEQPPSDMRGLLSSDTVLDFDWQLAIGDDPLTDEEMDLLAGSKRPVVQLRDQWLLVDSDLARKARERHLPSLTPLDALEVALTGEAADPDEGSPVEVAASPWLDGLRAHLAEPADDGADTLEQPPSLQARLREYQLHGLRWLRQMTSLGLGGCLADDMGLGKTITVIALHLHRQSELAAAGPTLVVCPASLLGNWQHEIERFAPGTACRRFHGTGRSLDGVCDGFVLTTYGTMRADTQTLTDHQPGWGLLVADETQHVKNPMSRTAKALRTIPAEARVALTGTPVENNLSELWSILDWTTPGLLGELATFRKRWAKPIEADHDDEVAARLSRLVRPFLLRRRKSDPGIAPELPPKTESDHPVSLTREQAGLYEAVVRETLAQIQDREGIERRGLIMKLLTACKQICNHPAHYLDEPSGGALTGRSGKLDLLDELVDTIVTERGAVLVFTQYVAMARLLQRHLTARGIQSLLLHGGTPVKRREQMVADFQAGEAPVFLLSLKAAGTGLNLTRADHVIHYDRWWNPAVEDQATDRAYRIGQTQAVQVHRIIAEGTVEDRIGQMIATKRELAEAVVSSGEAALTELSDTDLADLVELRRPG